MKKTLLLLLTFLLTLNFTVAQNPITDASDWDVSYNLTGTTNRLAYPYEITYGPDGWLWVTERRDDGGSNPGKRVLRVNPANWTKQEMINLSSLAYQTGGQDGVMGMAIHPVLYSDITTTANNYVFVAYTYSTNGTDDGRRTRIARFLFDNNTKTLSPDTSLDANGAIIEDLPASNDHNSGRLVIGPDMKLYYTIGDQGANQFGNACNPILAQVIPSQAEVDAEDYTNYPGKHLRLELDGSIPADNPTFDHDNNSGTAEVLSHIYTYGHRNAQGIIFASDGSLYNSEHGAKVDDEINKIVAGGNYGWPEIAGYYDNKSYSYCNWSSLDFDGDSGTSCSSAGFSDHNCLSGVTAKSEYDSFPLVEGAPTDFQPPIGTYGSTVNSDPSGNWLTWPTVAPSSIDIYEAGLIPGWGKSLFITTLKEGTIFRAKLTASGDAIEGDPNDGTKTGYEEFHSSNSRYRDLTFDPDGLTMYAITDTGGTTSGPSGSSPTTLEHKGEIVKITYSGATASTNNELLSGFQLYPNPSTNGFITVNIPAKMEGFNISVSNMLGQKVLTENYKQFKGKISVATNSLDKGLYFVTIESEIGKATKKLMIQ